MTVVASGQLTIVDVNDGVDGLTVIVSNEAVALPAGGVGNVLSYVGSGTTIQVFDGTTALSAVSSIIGNGQFRIASKTQNPAGTLTIGATSYAGTTATIANHSAMSNAVSAVSLTYGITVQRLNGATVTINKVQSISKVRDGTASNVAEFAVSGTWNKPAGATMVVVELWGAGGGGSGGGPTYIGGAGGGGGGYIRRFLNAEALPSSVSVLIGAGGLGSSGVNTFDGQVVGQDGGSSKFGLYAEASGGKGGGTYSPAVAGGDGGGVTGVSSDEAGATANTMNSSFGGAHGGAPGLLGSGFGVGATEQQLGGSSMFGGAGGGGGGGWNFSMGPGGDGGTSGLTNSVVVGGGAVGGTANLTSGGVAGDGANGAPIAGLPIGTGGGGGGSSNRGTGGKGGDGGIASGGGGGGSGGGNGEPYGKGGNGGNGGNGYARITTLW